LTSFKDYFKLVMELIHYENCVSRDISASSNPLANLQVHEH